MSTTIERYVIKHMSGSKTNQVEEFDFSKNELTIGRAASSEIQFDPEKEVVVSREHGKIVKNSGEPPRFTIVDNNSRNGIFVNKTRVKNSAVLHPGDEIQLGNNGPVFTFDIYPRPHDMMMATRVVEIPTSIKPTTISEVQTTEVVPIEPVKSGLGKQTVERMLVAERKKSYSTMAFGIGGLIILLGALGYTFRDKLFPKPAPTPAPIVIQDTTNKNKKSPDLISKENEDRVVQIVFSWELFDANTGNQLWHEYVQVGKGNQARFAAMFIQNTEGQIEPYVDVQNRVGTGLPVGGNNSMGSGFVVSADGYILTNRHVAATWHTRHDPFIPEFAYPGVLVNSKKEIVKDQEGNPIPVMPQDIGIWVPAETKMLGGRPAGQGTIQGRNKYINVVFAGTSLRRPVISVTPSDNHDVALIRADIPPSLTPVKMKDNYETVKPGQVVTVMGYPAMAPEQYVVRRSNDPFNPSSKFTTVPTPTVTPGNIGRIIPASSESAKTISTFGDSYQLTINATGGGNSGGPMFDDEGNVIGIYYSGSQRISFAVPIKYGLELLGLKKVASR